MYYEDRVNANLSELDLQVTAERVAAAVGCLEWVQPALVIELLDLATIEGQVAAGLEVMAEL